MNQSLQEILFELAVQKPTPAERAAFLDNACRGYPALRAQLDELLEAHFGLPGFLPKPTPPGPLPVTRPSISTDEAPARMIGPYKLLEQIGEGGMGEVWMAEQLEPVKRRVALKIIKPGMDSRQVVARFEAERQALAMMDHPNIAKVFDAGATATGRPYFVMELVKGVRITEFCDRNNLVTAERLALFVQVCHAIQHAHQKGVIHRDIKPSNVLVIIQDGVPVPKVIDFGIAKATEGRLTDATVSTQLHQFLGTPAYMSPEQAAMTGLDIDTRSDIYSLGVLLYELLTGSTPFDTKELLQSGLDEMRKIIRERQPLRPSTRLRQTAFTAKPSELSTLSSKLSTDLDWIVMKCLEKDRARRYDTANGLAADLERHLANEPVVARPPSAAYRLQKALRRNKTAFAVAALIAAVLVAATAVSVWQAVLAKQRLAESEAISKFLTEVFRSPDPSRKGDRSITVAETLDAAAKRLEKDLASQPARRAKLQANLGATYYGLGLCREAIPLQEKVRAYYLGACGSEHPDTHKAMQALASSYEEVGRRDEALKLREQGLPISRKVNGTEHPDTLRAMHCLAISYFEAGRLGEAIKLQEQVLALRRKVLGPEHPETLNSMLGLANSYDGFGRRGEALKLREEALPLSRKVNGAEDPDTLLAMQGVATSYQEAGRRDEALKLWEEVLPLSLKMNGPEHHSTLMAMHNLAVSYDAAGRLEEALKLREEVLALRRKVNGPAHRGTLSAMSNLAVSYSETGRRDEALKLREEVLALSRRANGPEHPDTLWAIEYLANSYGEAGRREEALKLREEALALSRKVRPPEHPDTLMAMINLAYSYRGAGRTDEAVKLGQSSLDLFRRVLAPTDEHTLNAMTELAVSYRAARRTQEAIALEEESLGLKRQHLRAGHPQILDSRTPDIER